MAVNAVRERYIAPIIEWAKKNKEIAEQKNVNLKSLLAAPEAALRAAEVENPFKIPVEFNGRDYITMLVQIDAEIEHGLMLQYLYAAYSIGGPQVPEKYRDKVRSWQDLILGIAKEEMGHFISVQNVLKVIGAPLNLGRESYPWDIPFYPFPFTLEQFTLDSLAKYVYAEAPAKWLDGDNPLAKEIKGKVDAGVHDPHTVGALFKIILDLIKRPEVIPDDAFQANTYPYQAKFNEWGRNYSGGNRGSDSKGRFQANPDVLVAPLLSRDDTYNALHAIAEQGEGEEISESHPSHFERFLLIYKELKAILEETEGNFQPSRPVATNPYISNKDVEVASTEGVTDEMSCDAISHPETKLWATLLNTRYRMLLNYLNHSFLLDNGFNNAGTDSPRGIIINSTFGEMYNLRSLSNILVQSPISEENPTKTAGPPFTLPYSLDLPFGEHNRWRVHKDLVIGAGKVIKELLAIEGQPHTTYLRSLEETDQKFLQTVNLLTEAVEA